MCDKMLILNFNFNKDVVYLDFRVKLFQYKIIQGLMKHAVYNNIIVH